MSRCRIGWRMRGWSGVSVRSVPRRVEQAIAVTHSVTCGNLVNLGTRTAPAERANVRGIRGLTTGKEWLP